MSVASGLESPARELAGRTHHMFGFDKESASDLRWRRRKSGWTVAGIQRASVLANPSSTKRDDVEKQLAHVGFWSVWRVVFANDVDMLQRLNRAFRGTADDCFDPTTLALVPRPAGQP